MTSFTKPVSVLSPATTANLGPGFDCLGMSLDLWNRLDVFPGPPEEGGELVQVVGEGAGELPTDRTNLVHRAMRFVFREAAQTIPPLHLRCFNQVPLSRGLGSSAAAIAGGLVAANALCGQRFSPNELLEMAATIEGHPDNVAAAVLGGLRLVVSDQQQLYTVPISIPEDVNAVLLVPEQRISTADARSVLPEQVPVADAVYNMGRIALLVAGLTENRTEYLNEATQDRLHQPYRMTIFPAMKLIFKAARDAGALCVFLSGSGSTIMALTRGREMTVAYEMFEAARLTGVEARVDVVAPTTQGAHLAGPD